MKAHPKAVTVTSTQATQLNPDVCVKLSPQKVWHVLIDAGFFASTDKKREEGFVVNGYMKRITVKYIPPTTTTPTAMRNETLAWYAEELAKSGINGAIGSGKLTVWLV